MDFFTVPTVSFQVFHVLFFVHHYRRQVVHWAITQAPNTDWIRQHLRQAFPFETAPRYLILDRDALFNYAVLDCIKAIGTKPKRMNRRSPWQNGVAERWIGSARRELLDHVVIFGQRHLHQLLSEYVTYFHEDRPHLGLAKDTPRGREPTPRPSPHSCLRSMPRVGFTIDTNGNPSPPDRRFLLQNLASARFSQRSCVYSSHPRRSVQPRSDDSGTLIAAKGVRIEFSGGTRVPRPTLNRFPSTDHGGQTMPIAPESISNFKRGRAGDSYLGIIALQDLTVYLALAQRRDGGTIDRERYSIIKGKTLDPLPGSGGHSTMSSAAGIPAEQVGQGKARGNARGFTLKKNDPKSFSIFAFRSGLNRQDDLPRPDFAQGTKNEPRTMDEQRILEILLPILTAGLDCTHERRASV